MTTTEINHHLDQLIGQLLGAEDIVLTIAEFLSAKECLSLQTTSRRLNDVMSKHETSLFDKHLRRDFPEGEVLSYVAKKTNLSRKKLYRAFAARWSLPKQADETLRAAEPSYYSWGDSLTDRNTKIITTWTGSLTLSDADYRVKKNLINDDVDNVVFIVSVGAGEGNSSPSFSALMEWNSEFDGPHFDFDQAKFDQLIIDKTWAEDSGIVPFLPDAGYMGEERCKLTLSLHAIETRYYQIASLMENTPMDESFYEEDRPQLNVLYGFSLPSLFGIPPKTSPFHNEVEEGDYDEVIKDGVGGVYPRLEYMTIRGRLRIAVNANQWQQGFNADEDMERNENEEKYELGHPWKGVNFCFTGEGDGDFECSVDQPYEICSFLTTLMKERCIQIVQRPRLDIAMISEQPEWVQTDKIIDTITSFVSYEDQASMMRLVCRNFRLSALRQIKSKLFQNKVIGFMKLDYYGEISFKATVRRGWSDGFERKGVIEDALRLASCRCRSGSCQGKKSCELGDHLSFQSSGSKSNQCVTQSIAVETVRQCLIEKGSVCVDKNFSDTATSDQIISDQTDNSVYCFYREEEMTLFELFSEIARGINYETDPHGYAACLHDDLKRDYGVLVSNNMYCRGFVRSILLPFATAMNKDHTIEEPREKKVRISPSTTNAMISEARSSLNIENGRISRKVCIYRFFSADNEPIEVRLDSFNYFDLDAWNRRPKNLYP